MKADEYAARIFNAYPGVWDAWGFWHWVGAEGYRTELYGDEDTLPGRAQALGVMLAKLDWQRTAGRTTDLQGLDPHES